MIGVRDLEIRIGPRVLMQGVNFRVDKGDKVGLVGRNGAGKTTLTKILPVTASPLRASSIAKVKSVIFPRTPVPETQNNLQEPEF